MVYNREVIASLICDRLSSKLADLTDIYLTSNESIQYFYLDDLLPEQLAKEIRLSFPKQGEMVQKKSLREFKFIAAQMDKYKPILEEVIYAFQDSRVVDLIQKITATSGLIPDDNLYAGGISYMGKGSFLNPHLDNSHDKDRKLWRVFNLLYYVSPDWKTEDGGNLELWPQGPRGKPIVIDSKFNRLAVMVTHNNSWHSVSKVKNLSGRCCVSNYYFSEKPMREMDSFHVTSFRGRPEEPVRDVILKCDIALRQGIRKIFKNGIVENPHVYKK